MIRAGSIGALEAGRIAKLTAVDLPVVDVGPAEGAAGERRRPGPRQAE